MARFLKVVPVPGSEACQDRAAELLEVATELAKSSRKSDREQANSMAIVAQGWVFLAVAQQSQVVIDDAG